MLENAQLPRHTSLISCARQVIPGGPAEPRPRHTNLISCGRQVIAGSRERCGRDAQFSANDAIRSGEPFVRYVFIAVHTALERSFLLFEVVIKAVDPLISGQHLAAVPV